ncbi:unnamed protein product [Strongylus vulgaris]|uniref:Uncharacterized protein n=1 Tax=Strongylus vulgaris TaxID=40348 RepID=A0A3P7KWG4_STRVU|nr:unnamed protein product [Strongylus vulgaris]
MDTESPEARQEAQPDEQPKPEIDAINDLAALEKVRSCSTYEKRRKQ